MAADTAETVAGVVRLLVRQTLDAARMLTPDVERMAAGVLSADGLPRYGWTDDKPDPAIYTVMLIRAVAERRQWRASTTGPSKRRRKLWTTIRQPALTRPTLRLSTARPPPMTRRNQGRRNGSQG
jgi:hypothetical protein